MDACSDLLHYSTHSQDERKSGGSKGGKKLISNVLNHEHDSSYEQIDRIYELLAFFAPPPQVWKKNAALRKYFGDQ